MALTTGLVLVSPNARSVANGRALGSHSHVCQQQQHLPPFCKGTRPCFQRSQPRPLCLHARAFLTRGSSSNSSTASSNIVTNAKNSVSIAFDLAGVVASRGSSHGSLWAHTLASRTSIDLGDSVLGEYSAPTLIARADMLAQLDAAAVNAGLGGENAALADPFSPRSSDTAYATYDGISVGRSTIGSSSASASGASASGASASGGGGYSIISDGIGEHGGSGISAASGSSRPLHMMTIPANKYDELSAALELLGEAGQHEDAIALATRLLNSRGSGVPPAYIVRDAALSLALSYRALAAAAHERGAMGEAYDYLEKAEKSVADKGIAPELQRELQAQLQGVLIPFALSALGPQPPGSRAAAPRARALSNIAHALALQKSARQRMQLLAPLRHLLTAMDQITVYDKLLKEAHIAMPTSSSASPASTTAPGAAAAPVLSEQELYDLAIAHIAEGYTAKWPHHIVVADELLARIEAQYSEVDVSHERSVCALMLGRGDAARFADEAFVHLATGGGSGQAAGATESWDDALLTMSPATTMTGPAAQPSELSWADSWLQLSVIPNFPEKANITVRLAHDYFPAPQVRVYNQVLRVSSSQGVRGALDGLQGVSSSALSKLMQLWHSADRGAQMNQKQVPASTNANANVAVTGNIVPMRTANGGGGMGGGGGFGSLLNLPGAALGQVVSAGRTAAQAAGRTLRMSPFGRSFGGGASHAAPVSTTSSSTISNPSIGNVSTGSISSSSSSSSSSRGSIVVNPASIPGNSSSSSGGVRTGSGSTGSPIASSSAGTLGSADGRPGVVVAEGERLLGRDPWARVPGGRDAVQPRGRDPWAKVREPPQPSTPTKIHPPKAIMAVGGGEATAVVKPFTSPSVTAAGLTDPSTAPGMSYLAATPAGGNAVDPSGQQRWPSAGTQLSSAAADASMSSRGGGDGGVHFARGGGPQLQPATFALAAAPAATVQQQQLDGRRPSATPAQLNAAELRSAADPVTLDRLTPPPPPHTSFPSNPAAAALSSYERTLADALAASEEKNLTSSQPARQWPFNWGNNNNKNSTPAPVPAAVVPAVAAVAAPIVAGAQLPDIGSDASLAPPSSMGPMSTIQQPSPLLNSSSSSNSSGIVSSSPGYGNTSASAYMASSTSSPAADMPELSPVPAHLRPDASSSSSSSFDPASTSLWEVDEVTQRILPRTRARVVGNRSQTSTLLSKAKTDLNNGLGWVRAELMVAQLWSVGGRLALVLGVAGFALWGFRGHLASGGGNGIGGRPMDNSAVEEAEPVTAMATVEDVTAEDVRQAVSTAQSAAAAELTPATAAGLVGSWHAVRAAALGRHHQHRLLKSILGGEMLKEQEAESKRLARNHRYVRFEVESATIRSVETADDGATATVVADCKERGFTLHKTWGSGAAEGEKEEAFDASGRVAYSLRRERAGKAGVAWRDWKLVRADAVADAYLERLALRTLA